MVSAPSFPGGARFGWRGDPRWSKKMRPSVPNQTGYSCVTWPFMTVITTLVLWMSCGATSNRFFSSTTRSASFPTSIEPIFSFHSELIGRPHRGGPQRLVQTDPFVERRQCG